MNKFILSAALINSFTLANVNASDFDGAYLGAGIGNNASTATSLPDQTQLYPAFKAGYNWEWNGILLGAEGLVDAHSASYTANDAGLDARLGYIIRDRWLPYIRVGMMTTNPGDRMHSGAGVEYKLTDRWSVNADWATDSMAIGMRTYKNENFTIGLNWHFGEGSSTDTPVVDDAAEARKLAAAQASPSYQMLLVDKPVTLPGTKFGFNQSRLNASASEQLDPVVQFALDYKDAQIIVNGYSDNYGDAQYNLELSAARAESVKAYLVAKGVAAERIVTRGTGSANPVADNETAEGRSQNRRVEINSVIKEENKVLQQ